ncbi:hypothetical protein QE374_002780 [Microbacterium sp. SORGH_AS428]|uniref:hypothetical protein n=1 Tax=Microbacterium sp. SORGH_AS_0428 TaxID=3041788 RepID=UPI00285858BC|nr:hypothetical protein [Microbacterium sp. SORGH_AS_0428]MDR6200871.1 hypothetical protein [Microbacterium sp. SORGH_AS_0428]
MTRPWRRFRRTSSVAAAVFAVVGALAIAPQAASAAEDVPQVIVSNLAVDTTTPEAATVTFDYAPNVSAEAPTRPYSLRVYVYPSNANREEGTIDFVTISSAGSYSKAFTLAPGSYNASVGVYRIENCECGGPEPTMFTTVPFTVTAVTPTPEPTPTTPEPTPEPTTPAPQPSETTAPATPTASLSATSVPAGGGVTVTATGLASNEPVELWIHSTPIQLWTGTADGSGALTQAITIPADLPLGAHQVEVRGAASGSLWLNISVRGAELAATGVDGSVGAGLGIGAATLLLAGAAVLLLAKHRRREAA